MTIVYSHNDFNTVCVSIQIIISEMCTVKHVSSNYQKNNNKNKQKNKTKKTTTKNKRKYMFKIGNCLMQVKSKGAFCNTFDMQ